MEKENGSHDKYNKHDGPEEPSVLESMGEFNPGAAQKAIAEHEAEHKDEKKA